MGRQSNIEWTEHTWNPIRGCTRVSAGCEHCYAERIAARFSGPGMPYEGLAEMTPPGPRWTGEVRLVEEKLAEPLSWREPAMVFVDSMSDLFHEGLTDEQIAVVFGVMAACPQHTFQVLTKRPERMQSLLSDAGFPARVDLMKHVAVAGRIEEVFAAERFEAIEGWPGYWVTTKGRVFSDHKGERREMTPMSGGQGHARVMLYRGEETGRPLIHHLVLGAFDRPRVGDEQCCHIDGNPTNNALWNLRWGTQSSNWDDSKRHGTRRRYSKLTEAQVEELRAASAAGVSGAELGRRYGISDTQARNIATGRQWAPPHEPTWPLPGVWLGVSVEDQATADERIPVLLDTPAAVRFVSCEPLLGPINLRLAFGPHVGLPHGKAHRPCCPGSLDWVIAGGESGPGARPMDPAWPRALRDECQAAGVPFFFKSWGAWAPLSEPIDDGRDHPTAKLDGATMCRYGKKAAGRELDGRTWDEIPEV